MNGDKFMLPVRIYYEDTDAGGVVYHANYLKFFERARTEWLRALEIEQRGLLEQGIAFVVRAASIEYLRPARLDDELMVETRIDTLKRASLVFAQRLLTQDGVPLVTGLIKVASVDLKRGIPVPIPDSIKGALHRVC